MSKILIVEARFYDKYAKKLVASATNVIEKAGYEIETIEVPGCFEIPAAISFAIKSGKYAGYVGLGCVIRGETTHYDYVCAESARGINQLAMDHHAAIGYGIITAENHSQAVHRAEPQGKDTGGRAASACLRMIEINKQLNG